MRDTATLIFRAGVSLDALWWRKGTRRAERAPAPARTEPGTQAPEAAGQRERVCMPLLALGPQWGQGSRDPGGGRSGGKGQ